MEDVTFESMIKEHYHRLSAGQKKVAEYLIEQMEEAAFSTAAQIGKKADVSETTVIRLSYALGFKGFPEMQEKIQSQYRKGNIQNYGTDSLESASVVDDDLSQFSKVVENDIQIMRRTLRQLPAEDLWKAVDELIAADRILVVGYRLSYASAYWFSCTLGSLRENVDLCPPAGDVYERLCNLTDKSVVFVISFPRYSREALRIAECAKKQGVKVVAVTDRVLSPIGRMADITFTTEENMETGSNSIAPVISLLDLMIMGIHQKDRERIRQRQQKLELLYASNDMFIE